MKWFDNMKISYKFIGSFAVVIVLLMVGNIAGVLNANKLNQNVTNIYEQDLTLIKISGEIASSVNRINSSVGSYILTQDKDYLTTVEQQTQNINSLLEQLYAQQLLESELRDLEVFRIVWNGYPPIIERIVANVQNNEMEFAISSYKRELLTKEDGIHRAFQGFIENNRDKAANRYEESKAMYSGILSSSIAIMVLTLLLSLVMGYLLNRSITGPILRLLKSFKRIEEGDLSQPIEEKRKDELGQLAAGSENMRKSIADIVSQTKEAVHTLANVSEEVRVEAQETGTSSQLMFQGLKDTASRSKEQAGKISDDAQMIKEMMQSLGQIAASVDSVSTLSADLKQTADRGRIVVQDASDTMNEIKLKSEETSSIVEMLNEQSKQIDTVIATIKEIAEETNLLSLNASIEAARAGDAGRGFAVVATEIRKLAENSKASAEQVREVVASIQEGTAQLFKSNQISLSEIHEGHGKMEDVLQSFQQIFEWIENINMSIQDITAGVEELSAGSEQIDHSMRRIEAYSDDVAQTNESYAQQSGQQVSRMEKVNAAVGEMLKLSNALNGLVNRFVTESR
jgi:methyl-accepting chemotaxis protein